MGAGAAAVVERARRVAAAFVTPPAVAPGTARVVSRVLVAASVLFTGWAARTELLVAAPDHSDRVMHVTMANHAAAALTAGADPTDHWVPEIATGYPIGHHYQHLPHVATALVHRALGGTVSMPRLVGALTLLCLACWPLALYAAGRRLGLDRLAAGVAALCGPLVATNGQYGLEFGSVCAGGLAMYGQAFGLVLLPLAIAEGVRACRTGRRIARTAALLALCGLAHLLSGYLAAVSLVVCAVWPRAGAWARVRRLAGIAGLAGLASAYQLVPLVQDWVHQNVSAATRTTQVDKLGSRGHLEVLSDLFRGELFDHGRPGVLTLLLGLGIALAIARRGAVPVARLLVLGAVWLALYFGRPTWGALLDLLPLHGHLHMQRFIAGVHLVSAWLIGLAGGTLLALVLSWRADWARAAGLLALAGLVLPAHLERARTLAWHGRWQRETAAAWRERGGDVEGAFAAIRARAPGRVYAGLPLNWGQRYRIGHVPVYDLVPLAGLDAVGYLYHDFSHNADLMASFDDRVPAVYDLFNVRYVILPAESGIPPFYRLIGQFGYQALYEVATPGYFSLVDAEPAAFGSPADLPGAVGRWIQSTPAALGVHPRLALGAGPASGTVPFAALDAAALAPYLRPREPRGRVLAETVGDGRYTARVEATRDCWLMGRFTFHPGWHASVDGVPVEPEMLAPAFVGVPLAAGPHLVELEYRPPWWRKWLLLLGIVVLAAVAAAERRRAGRAGAAATLTPVSVG